jgi:hypothetical protein
MVRGSDHAGELLLLLPRYATSILRHRHERSPTTAQPLNFLEVRVGPTTDDSVGNVTSIEIARSGLLTIVHSRVMVKAVMVGGWTDVLNLERKEAEGLQQGPHNTRNSQPGHWKQQSNRATPGKRNAQTRPLLVSGMGKWFKVRSALANELRIEAA